MKKGLKLEIVIRNCMKGEKNRLGVKYHYGRRVKGLWWFWKKKRRLKLCWNQRFDKLFCTYSLFFQVYGKCFGNPKKTGAQYL